MKDIMKAIIAIEKEPELDMSSKIRHAENSAKAQKKELDDMFEEAFGDRKIIINLGNNKDNIRLF